MLILLPPSESKNPPPKRGKPVDLEALSFPTLTALRAQVFEALVATSGQPDALARLGVGASIAHEVERNVRLGDIPARPALEVYNGVLYEALGAATLPAAAKRRAASRVIVVSALWGAVRPIDRIPAYRLDICARLVGLGCSGRSWPRLQDVAGWSSTAGLPAIKRRVCPRASVTAPWPSGYFERRLVGAAS